jgi:hypothetical protein
MTFLRNFVVIGVIVFACYFGFRKPLESELPPAATTAVVIDPETLSATEKFTREWFDLHSDMPRGQAVEQFMHDAYTWTIAYRAQHGLPPLTVREGEALQDKLCARVRCRN